MKNFQKINTYYVVLVVLIFISAAMIGFTLNVFLKSINTVNDLTQNSNEIPPVSTTSVDRKHLDQAFKNAFERSYIDINIK